jgi:hypothetical protein
MAQWRGEPTSAGPSPSPRAAFHAAPRPEVPFELMSRLPDDFSLLGPAQVFLNEAWAAHSQRGLLEERGRERDENANLKWKVGRELADDGWLEYWQLTENPLDEREPIRVGAWPEKRETDALADEQAQTRGDEQNLD